MCKQLLVIPILFLSIIVSKNIEIKSNDGKTYILYENGTWKEKEYNSSKTSWDKGKFNNPSKSFKTKEEYINYKKNDGQTPILITQLISNNSFNIWSGDYFFPIYIFESFSDKLMKYVTIEYDWYNRFKEYTKSGKARSSGPFKKGDIFKYECEDDSSGFTIKSWDEDTHCLLLKSIKIEYLDGTIETYTENQIDDLLLPEKFMKSASNENWLSDKANICCNYYEWGF